MAAVSLEFCTMIGPRVDRIHVDLRANRLRLDIDQPLRESGDMLAIVDIGALGRLVGIEVGGVYLSISDPVPGSELQGRSVEIALEISTDRHEVTIPRRGPGWELSFPSGNQCWNQADGEGGIRPLCAVLAGS